MATVSIVLPVYNRDLELRRALTSAQRQSYADFECLVVYEDSPIDTATIVADYGDARFRCIRGEARSGPAAARRSGFAQVSGDYVLALDSDWELYPWALDQGVRRFASNPTVDVVCALHLHNEDSRLFARVAGSERVITPTEFRELEPAPDRVAMVRRNVTDEWLAIPGDYFALESGLWITTELSHSSLALDEPWVRYHTASADRLTTGLKTEGGRTHRLRDCSTFLDKRQDLIDCGPCISVDRMLEEMYFDLTRAKHPYAAKAAAALVSRGVRPQSAFMRQTSMRARRRLGRPPSVHWV